MLNGKLDEKTFKELIKKMWNLAREFYEKINKIKNKKTNNLNDFYFYLFNKSF
jgi:hypothetical protein